MRKFFFLALSLFLLNSLSAQVFNTAATLKPGAFSIGINPGVFAPKNAGDTKFALYMNGGYGLRSGIDFNLRLGTGPDDVYIGGDAEFAFLSGNINGSLAAGAHVWEDFGLDATLNFDYQIAQATKLYWGLDADFVFADETNLLPMWLFIGVDIPIRKDINFRFESDIAISDDTAFHIIHGGIEIYL
jgi:hypothetical protein